MFARFTRTGRRVSLTIMSVEVTFFRTWPLAVHVQRVPGRWDT